MVIYELPSAFVISTIIIFVLRIFYSIRKGNEKMKTRIFSIIMLVTLLPMLIIMLLIQVAAVRTLDSFLEKSLTNRAAIVNDNIDTIPHMASMPLQEVAREDIFKELLRPNRNTRAFPDLVVEEEARSRMEIKEIDNLFIVDQTGEVVLSQNAGEEGLILNRTKPYQKIMSGAEINTEITIGSDGTKALRVSLPIKSQDGSILGIINGNIDAKNLVKAVENMCADICEEVYLIGSDTILSSKESKMEGTNYDVPSDFKGKCQLYDLMVDFRSGALKEDQGIITYKAQGKQMVGAFVRLKNAEGLMVLAQDKKVIYNEVKDVRLLLQVIFFTVILWVVIFAILIALRLYRPIKELCLHTRALAEGETTTCTNLGHNEYDEICKNINRIADNLQKSEEELELSLKTDSLTRIPTAIALYENIETLWDNQENQALLMIAFDGIRGINQTFGYDIGDRIFWELGHILRNLPEEICHPARLTGGRFLVFMSGWAAHETPEDMAKKIIEEVRALHFIDDIRINIEASIGIRYIWKEDREDFKEIIRQSDLAMNKGREMGKNIYVVYHEENVKGM